MSTDRGVVLSSVKARMQALRDELDNTKDAYDAKCKECEALVEEKNQVTFSLQHYSNTLQITCYLSYKVFAFKCYCGNCQLS